MCVWVHISMPMHIGGHTQPLALQAMAKSGWNSHMQVPRNTARNVPRNVPRNRILARVTSFEVPRVCPLQLFLDLFLGTFLGVFLGTFLGTLQGTLQGTDTFRCFIEMPSRAHVAHLPGVCSGVKRGCACEVQEPSAGPRSPLRVLGHAPVSWHASSMIHASRNGIGAQTCIVLLLRGRFVWMPVYQAAWAALCRAQRLPLPQAPM